MTDYDGRPRPPITTEQERQRETNLAIGDLVLEYGLEPEDAKYTVAVMGSLYRRWVLTGKLTDEQFVHAGELTALVFRSAEPRNGERFLILFRGALQQTHERHVARQ